MNINYPMADSFFEIFDMQRETSMEMTTEPKAKREYHPEVETTANPSAVVLWAVEDLTLGQRATGRVPDQRPLGHATQNEWGWWVSKIAGFPTRYYSNPLAVAMDRMFAARLLDGKARPEKEAKR